jgi:8-oxo-dGTP diphosphatase
MVTVDAVIFTVRDSRLEVLLIRRKRQPFQGMWALPGGFLDMDENLEVAAARELLEETGLCDIPLEQFHTFGEVGRDPRGRVITVAYWGLADWHIAKPEPADDAEDAAWLAVANLPQLATDHNQIVDRALFALQQRLALAAINPLALPGAISIENLRRATKPL